MSLLVVQSEIATTTQAKHLLTYNAKLKASDKVFQRENILLCKSKIKEFCYHNFFNDYSVLWQITHW